MHIRGVTVEPAALTLEARQVEGKYTSTSITWTELRNGKIGNTFYVPKYGVSDRMYEESAKIVYKDESGCALLITNLSKHDPKELELQWFEFCDPSIQTSN